MAFLAIGSAVVSSFALEGETDLEDINKYLDRDDIDALKEWVRERKQHVKVKKPPGSLVLSGEVRTELQSTNEKLNKVKQLGSGGAVPGTSARTWDIEVRLQLDYKTERTWAQARLRFDNDAGTRSGTTNRLKLDRAFLGGKIINASDYSIKLQAGRWDLSLYFDSQIQFLSLMDGILFLYDHALDWAGDFYLHGGPFVVDEKIDQFAYVGEVGLLNIGKTGLYSKVAFIDWDTKNTSKKDVESELRNREYRFRNWQVIVGYKWTPALLGKGVDCFVAYLINTAAKRLPVTANKKANMAWYTGFRIGSVKKQWDWSFQFVYEWLQAQSVPGFDVLGVGRGNAAKVGLYGKGTTLFNSPSQARGNTNYRGLSAILQYMLTDNITVYQRWRQSTRLSSAIGVPFSYKQYEIELIYGF
ncbi:MAG: hypothetical protein AAF443_03725 [Chlamydiota bacterium]